MDKMNGGDIMKSLDAWFLTFIFIGSIIFYIYITSKYQICSDSPTYHNERVKPMLDYAIDGAIELNKKERVMWMEEKGYSKNMIDEKILSLKSNYQKEREKIYKYCHIDELTTLDYFMGYNHSYKFCSIYHHWSDSDTDWTGYRYKFDRESYLFFNEIKKLYYKDKMNSSDIVEGVDWYEEKKIGLSNDAMFLNCRKISGNFNNGLTIKLIPFLGNLNEDNNTKYKLWR